MNALLRCALIVLLTALAPSGTCRAQNQHEMNREAARAFETADASLNKVYQQLTAKLDKESQGKLIAAQRAWVQFRDAEAQFQADLDARDGSMAPLIYDSTRAELTKRRIKDLEPRLKDFSHTH